MSSILKALEKVDESQRSTRSAGTGRLPRGRERRPAWLIPAWALGGAAVAALATYAAMGGFSHPAAQLAQGRAAVAPSPPVQAVPTVVVAPAVPVTEKRGAVGPGAAAPSAATRTTSAVALSKPAAPQASLAKPAPASHPAVKSAAKPVAGPGAKSAVPAQTAAKAPAASAATAPVAAREPAVQKPGPELRVTGIAWQNSSEASFAMVNGHPLRQGAVVEGYRIEQIYEDSVRFSKGQGSSLVVPLGAGQN